MSFENVTIYREQPDGEELELELDVHFHYCAGCRGLRDRYGAPETPDDPEELEMEHAYDQKTGEEVELTRKEIKEVEAKLWEIIHETVGGRF